MAYQPIQLPNGIGINRGLERLGDALAEARAFEAEQNRQRAEMLLRKQAMADQKAFQDRQLANQEQAQARLERKMNGELVAKARQAYHAGDQAGALAMLQGIGGKVVGDAQERYAPGDPRAMAQWEQQRDAFRSQGQRQAEDLVDQALQQPTDPRLQGPAEEMAPGEVQGETSAVPLYQGDPRAMQQQQRPMMPTVQDPGEAPRGRYLGKSVQVALPDGSVIDLDPQEAYQIEQAKRAETASRFAEAYGVDEKTAQEAAALAEMGVPPEKIMQMVAQGRLAGSKMAWDREKFGVAEQGRNERMDKLTDAMTSVASIRGPMSDPYKAEGSDRQNLGYVSGRIDVWAKTNKVKEQKEQWETANNAWQLAHSDNANSQMRAIYAWMRDSQGVGVLSDSDYTVLARALGGPVDERAKAWVQRMINGNQLTESSARALGAAIEEVLGQKRTRIEGLYRNFNQQFIDGEPSWAKYRPEIERERIGLFGSFGDLMAEKEKAVGPSQTKLGEAAAASKAKNQERASGFRVGGKPAKKLLEGGDDGDAVEERLRKLGY